VSENLKALFAISLNVFACDQEYHNAVLWLRIRSRFAGHIPTNHPFVAIKVGSSVESRGAVFEIVRYTTWLTEHERGLRCTFGLEERSEEIVKLWLLEEVQGGETKTGREDGNGGTRLDGI
jgi:hypothetical protein